MSDPANTNVDNFDGITEEDRDEIMLEIERVAGENRISLTNDLFEFTARKNGAAFPVLVNVAGLLLLAAGIAAFLFIFQADDAEIKEAGRVEITSESLLIEEIRRTAQEELAAKDQEIAEIQTRLGEIDAERSALAGSLEEQVALREEELRRELEAELEAERRRLRSLDLSEQEIELRIASFAEVKEREFAQRLDQFRRQKELEQTRLVQELNQREAEYTRSLEDAARQREALQADSAEQLAALQREFDQQLAAGRAELDETQAELLRLNRQQEQAEFLGSQIRGLYQIAAEALRQGNHQLAKDRLDDLRVLLNDESVLRTPAVAERRPTDLLLTNLFETLIDLDARFGSAEAERRLNQGELVERVSELVGRASAEAEAGRTETAVGLYRQALEVIPAVSESYSFLGDPDDADVAADLATANEESARLVAEAERARTDGRFSVAIDRYTTVLRDYPRSRYRTDAIAGIEATYAAAQSRDLTLQDSLTASLADVESERGRIAEELASTQNDLERVQTISARQNERIEQLTGRIATLQDRPDTSASEVEALQRELTRSRESLQAEQERAETLEEAVAIRETALQETEAELVETLEELAIAQVLTESGLDTERELLEEVVRLQALEAEVTALRENWTEYRQEVATIAERSGTTSNAPTAAPELELLEARVSLERFLGEPTMQQYFPEISDEIGRFYDAFAAGGRENALLDASDILLDLSYAEDNTERINLVRNARGEAEPALADFLTELEVLLSSVY
jgi:hypothetical protein